MKKLAPLENLSSVWRAFVRHFLTGLALLSFLLILPLTALASGVVNINTADTTLLQTLSGIGPTKAGAIISYRSAHGDFAKISDIQNVSGIGPATYAQIESSITVDGSSTATAPTQASSTSSTNTSSSATPTPSDPAVRVDAGGNRTVIAGADTTYTASITDKNGTPYPASEVHWIWGDGSSAVGTSVLKSYKLPGTYLVGVSALAGMGSGGAQFQVVVKDAAVAVSALSPDGITIKNLDSANTLDLSYWQLVSGAGVFTLPSGTKILNGGTVTFPAEITGLASSVDASLRYPSGKVAALYGAQPSLPVASSYQVQNINAVIAPVHANPAVSAPTASTQVAAVGAALPPEAAPGKPTPSHLLKTLESPWTLGFLGLLVFSAGAFIVL